MGRYQERYRRQMDCAQAAREHAVVKWQEISMEEYHELYLNSQKAITSSGTLLHPDGWIEGYFTDWLTADGLRLRYESRAEGSTYFRQGVK